MNGLVKNISISIIVTLLIAEFVSCEFGVGEDKYFGEDDGKGLLSRHDSDAAAAATVNEDDFSLSDLEKTVLIKYYLDLLRKQQKKNRFFNEASQESPELRSPSKVYGHRLKELLEKRAMKNVAFGFGKK